jgi:hypothetical protein
MQENNDKKKEKAKTVMNKKIKLPDALCLNGTFTLLLCCIKQTHCF